MNQQSLGRRAAAWSASALVALTCAGCPFAPPEFDEQAAVHAAAVIFQGLNLAGTISNDNVNNVAEMFGGAKIDVSRDIDRTIDLDAVDGQGGDLFPNATGQLRLTGQAQLAGNPLAGATAGVDPLKTTYLTDVMLTDPDSGARATFAQDAVIMSSVAGTYTYDLQGVFNSAITSAMDTQDLEVTVYTPADQETKTVNVDADVETMGTYADDNVLDENPGEVTHSIDAVLTATWAQTGFLGRQITHTVKLSVAIDNSVDPAVEEVLLTVNGKDYGPYTLEEFRDQWKALLELF